MEAMSSDQKTLTKVFIRSARTYWFSVFPLVHRERCRWRNRAKQIPDDQLRALALSTQCAKYGNVEGAAAFAAFVPRSRRAIVVRALVAWQAAYDYADTLAEQPCTDH